MGKRENITLDFLKNTPAGKLPANAHLFASTDKPKKSRAKYNNTKVEYEGLVFDSKREYQRYRELLIMLKQGIIGQLERQVSYLLIPASDTERKCEYIADHRYIEVATGQTIVEDSKGHRTPDYIIKKKLMLSVHGIVIKEV